MRKILRIIITAVLGIVLLAAAAATVSGLVNLNRPTQSATPERLDPLEAARLSEFFHVRQALGDAAWPGWGAVDSPVIVYNEDYAFLVGLPHPADGWVKVPQNQARGGPWELMPDAIDGRPVHRQPLAASGANPEAFAVRVGDVWVAALPTMEWMRIGLTSQLHDSLPPVVNWVFPYSLMTGQLVNSSDHYISLLAHEAFHAYQGAVAPQRLAAAESTVGREESYPWDDAALETSWQAELDLLAAAVAAPPEEAADYARKFLRRRDERREAAGLHAAQIDYERQREWLEGLARYVELALWREAGAADGYHPSAAIEGDPEFDGYTTYERRLSREIDQIGRMADDEGDGRFYYSGYAQAVLLDRLAPNWKEKALEPDVFLETLLAQTIGE